ncbi:hypothetical protein CfE428DRAFT_6058 [Chthoniobacter flavus Ellin428]|uniref:Uncharacterized protein n=2 Tax=Chthoniobacter flavus TaxID=191863 RepID=B4DAW7_9BACT|nr:hypothetical protein CfE428DRAFT_6058 [Chthoniobacter flavus Ellin428]TCO84548.1 hypothetical protein EV701_13513 [Chthoniobacter flavus]
MIPNEPGTPWYSFLKSRFIEAQPPSGKGPLLSLVIQTIQQQSPVLADIQGLVELSLGSALPVVSAFVGQLNLETRDFSIRQDQSAKIFSGQLSDNGRVMVLREAGQAKQIHLVHEATLAQLL